MSTPRYAQAGFTIVTAVFLLVVLATLGAFMVSISGVQHQTSSFAVQGSRAYHAAKSGIEWGIYQAFNNTAAACGAAPNTPTTSNFNLASTATTGFSLSVTCRYTRHKERNQCFNTFVISSTASYGSYGQGDFVSRRLRASATDHAAPLTGCP